MVFRGHEVDGTACASGPRSGPGSAARPYLLIIHTCLFDLPLHLDYIHGFVALSSVWDIFGPVLTLCCTFMRLLSYGTHQIASS